MKTFEQYINETMEFGRFVVFESDAVNNDIDHEFFDTETEAVEVAEEIINLPVEEMKTFRGYYQVEVYETDPKTKQLATKSGRLVWAKHATLEDGVVQIRDGKHE